MESGVRPVNARRWRRVVLAILLVTAAVVALVSAGPALVNAAGPLADGDRHIITASAGEGGTIDPIGAVEVTEPADLTFTITAADGYHVADVLVDGASVGAVDTYEFTDVTANHTIEASFAVDTYTLTYSAAAGGSIEGTTPQTVAHGEDGTEVTAAPDTGYRFTAWSDGVTTATRTDRDVTADLDVTASFARRTYTITASAGDHGTIDPNGEVEVAHGDDQVFTITPASGYHVADVLVDDISVGARTTYEFPDVTGDHTISASFAIDTFRITATAGAHGTISPSGAVEIDYGAGQTFTIAPASGYYVADVLVDDASQGPVTTYTFEDVRADHTIEASFAVGARTAVFLRAGKSVIDYGKSTALSGGLWDVSDPKQRVGLGDRTVTVLWALSSGGPWTVVPDLPSPTTSAEPDSVGAFSASVKPSNTTLYRVRFTPEVGSEYGPALSNDVRVSVRPLLGMPQVRKSVRAGRSFTVYGTLKPQFPAGQKTVKVKIYRSKNGRWVYVRQVSATNVDKLANTRYVAKLKLTAKGRYRFKAYTLKTATWAADTTKLSASLRVR